VLVVLRFTIAAAETDGFHAAAREALEALASRPGHLSGRLLRAVEDPTGWLVVTEWDGVGSWRRALSSYDVRVRATPLLARSAAGPSAYEPVD
jgi:heme-degrading monooxygenase HmoA